MDFFVSWLAVSHSFWSPVIYWTLNERFQRATLRFFIKKVNNNRRALDQKDKKNLFQGVNGTF